MTRIPHLIFSVCALFTVSGVQAAMVYSYTGSHFDTVIDATPPSPPIGMYSTSMRLEGSFTVASALTATTLTNITALVTDFSFTDGRNTLTQANSSSFNFSVELDALGNIANWIIRLEDISISTLLGDQHLKMSTVWHTPSRREFDEAVIQECILVSGGNCVFAEDRAQAVGALSGGNNVRGIWTSMTAPVVPIPAAVWLFLSGLGLLGWMRHRQAA